MTTANILLALLLAATLADHVTTNIFLKRGMREANPLLPKIIARWGSTGLFLTKLALWGAIVAVDRLWSPLPTLFLAACVGVYAVVAAWNGYQIALHRSSRE